MFALLSLLETCGRHGKWVLPLGLIAGFALPEAAEPMRRLIPLCIAVLLFLSVLRLLTARVNNELDERSIRWQGLWLLVVVSQLILPVLLYFFGQWLGLDFPWIIALTLVAAASPISGSPNLVQMLGGDDALTLRWLILGTAMLPLTCLPIMFLLFPSESPLLLVFPSLKLMVLIGSAVVSAYLVASVIDRSNVALSVPALDGAASITLALIVIGLMSAFHDPANAGMTLLQTLFMAITINFGLQVLGVLAGFFMRQRVRNLIASGVVCGNRNIALYLAALPLSLTEPLLLFIACYQIPMYITPLLGGLFYRRL